MQDWRSPPREASGRLEVHQRAFAKAWLAFYRIARRLPTALAMSAEWTSLLLRWYVTVWPRTTADTRANHLIYSTGWAIP